MFGDRCRCAAAHGSFVFFSHKKVWALRTLPLAPGSGSDVTNHYDSTAMTRHAMSSPHPIPAVEIQLQLAMVGGRAESGVPRTVVSVVPVPSLRISTAPWRALEAAMARAVPAEDGFA